MTSRSRVLGTNAQSHTLVTGTQRQPVISSTSAVAWCAILLVRRLGSRGSAHGRARPLTSCGTAVDEVSTATATSRTSGETMELAAVLLDRLHRARETPRRLELVE